ncbi:MAG: hypothetical protein RIS64_2904 [Bacteroidota bacterium]
MINKTLYLICLITLSFLMSNCSVYGPAYQGQQLSYLETPTCKDGQTQFQAYAGGSLSSGSIYQTRDKNANGSFTAHIAWSSTYREVALGLYGFAGQYLANVNNIEKSLMYRGLGLRAFQTWSIPLNDEAAWQIFGISIALHHETGDYTRFRDTFRFAQRTINNFNTVRGNVESPLSLVAGVTTGLKIHLKKEHSLLVRYMFGGASSTAFLLPEIFFHQFTVNYKFQKASVYGSIVVGDVGRVSVNLPFQLGISVPLYSN